MPGNGGAMDVHDGRYEVEADLPRLVLELDADDPLTRAAASRALGEVRAFGSVDLFLSNLASDNVRVARWSATALGLHGDERALPALLGLLGNPDPERREAAAGALGLLGDPRALDALVAALDDPSGHVAQAAAISLTRLGDERGARAAWDRLLSQLRDGDRTERALAARTLGALAEPQARDALVAAMRDPSPEVRADAAAALGNLADRSALDCLLEAGFRDTDAEVRDAAMFALARLSADKAGAGRVA